jgi:hypothetical protein
MALERTSELGTRNVLKLFKVEAFSLKTLVIPACLPPRRRGAKIGDAHKYINKTQVQGPRLKAHGIRQNESACEIGDVHKYINNYLSIS